MVLSSDHASSGHDLEDLPWGTYAPAGLAHVLIHVCRALPLSLRAFTRLLRRPLKYGEHRPYDVIAKGLRMRLFAQGNITDSKLLFSERRHDEAELRFVRQALADGGVMVDVGANIGLYTCVAAKELAAHGRVVAFEPDPVLMQRLRFHVSANQLTNVSLVPVAVSDQNGMAMLAVNRRQRGTNSLAAVNNLQERDLLEVRATTLLQALQEAEVRHVQLLKIDIEGYEQNVLTEFFRSAPPECFPKWVLIEVKPATTEVLHRLLTENGYTLTQEHALNRIYGHSGGQIG